LIGSTVIRVDAPVTDLIAFVHWRTALTDEYKALIRCDIALFAEVEAVRHKDLVFVGEGAELRVRAKPCPGEKQKCGTKWQAERNR